MSVIILNVGGYGGTEIDVPYVSATEGAPVYVGDVSDSFSGAERNSIRAVKRTFTLTTGYVDSATEALVRSAIGNLAQIPCKGDLFGNSLVAVTCSVAISNRQMIPGLSPVAWQLTLTVKFTTAT